MSGRLKSLTLLALPAIALCAPFMIERSVAHEHDQAPHILLGGATVLPADSHGVVMDVSGSVFQTQELKKSQWYDRFQMVRLGEDDARPLPLHISNSPVGDEIFLIEPAEGFVRGSYYELSYADCDLSEPECKPSSSWVFEIDQMTWDEVMEGWESELVISELSLPGEGNVLNADVHREVSVELPLRAERWREGLLMQSEVEGQKVAQNMVSIPCHDASLGWENEVHVYARASVIMPRMFDAERLSAARHVPLTCDALMGRFSPDSVAISKENLERAVQTTSPARGFLIFLFAFLSFTASVAVRRSLIRFRRE